MIRETRRWYGVTAVAFLAAAAGIIAKRPPLLLVSAVGAAFAAYARSGVAPDVALSVERDLDDPDPEPGEAVTVTVSATNEGGLLADLRLVDGVPEGLSVAGGSPRLGTALRPGKTATVRYTVEAARGEHRFDPVTVVARDPSGAVERETTIGVETTLSCVPRLPSTTAGVPLRRQTAQYTGPVTTDTGGTGIEFHALREYRPGDALTRVDWKRLARTGRLATVQYREERMATVVLLIDARRDAYVGGEPHAVDRGVEAARYAAAALFDAGHRVGIAGLGREPCWLAPGTGEEHRAAARRVLATHPALASTPPATRGVAVRRLRTIRARLPEDAQVLLLSPLADDYGATIGRRLDAHGHAVTVVSPDVTATTSPGRRLARVERRLRIARLRSVGIPVIDWPADEAFEEVLVRAGGGR